MVVTPPRDGMNLVAKEYVACRVDGSGTLVLSEFAGAALELTRALLVNPYDLGALADAMAQAITMPDQEMHARMRALRRQVMSHDVHEWAKRALEAFGAID
jgi:trehalose 6-phosphate synthase